MLHSLTGINHLIKSLYNGDTLEFYDFDEREINKNTILITSNKFLLSEKYNHIYFIPSQKNKLNTCDTICEESIESTESNFSILSFILAYHNLSNTDGNQIINILEEKLNINKNICFVKIVNFKNVDLQSLLVKPITILLSNIYNNCCVYLIKKKSLPINLLYLKQVFLNLIYKNEININIDKLIIKTNKNENENYVENITTLFPLKYYNFIALISLMVINSLCCILKILNYTYLKLNESVEISKDNFTIKDKLVMNLKDINNALHNYCIPNKITIKEYLLNKFIENNIDLIQTYNIFIIYNNRIVNNPFIELWHPLQMIFMINLLN